MDSRPDIGIVLLPNQQCKNFTFDLTADIKLQFPELKKLENNLHITLLHLANLNLNESFKSDFEQFVQEEYVRFPLPITKIKATGGSKTEGFKWLDLQFEASTELTEFRDNILTSFCKYHNGILPRMLDDYDKYDVHQLSQIEECGVVVYPYIPHISLWYIDLPDEKKSHSLYQFEQSVLEQLLDNEVKLSDMIECYAESIALVELGRNGNAIKVIGEYPLNAQDHIFIV